MFPLHENCVVVYLRCHLPTPSTTITATVASALTRGQCENSEKSDGNFIRILPITKKPKNLRFFHTELSINLSVNLFTVT